MSLKLVLKAVLFLSLMVSVLLRPVMAQVLIVPDDMHQTSQGVNHKTMDGDHCQHMAMQMASAEHSMPDCCAHHHQHLGFSSTPCPECGDHCDCAKHLHVSSSALNNIQEHHFVATAQAHFANLQTRVISFIPSTLERPPQSF